MIDRSLNYGRNIVRTFLQKSMPYRSVLDIGAGRGDDLLLAKAVNSTAELYAVEACEKYAQLLSKKGIYVHSLDIEKEKFPFTNGGIDILIMNQLLEHTKEIFWIFHETTRILPVGGRVILGVPNLASFHNRILLFMGKHPSSIKSHSAHIRGFTKSDLLSFIETCFPGGYKVKSFEGSNFYPFPPKLAKPLAKLFPTFAWGIFFLFEKQRPYGTEFLDYPVRERLETNFFLGK